MRFYLGSFWTIACCVAIVAFTGCAEKIDEGEIPGIYKANFAPWSTIEVLRNNLYIHKVQHNGSVEVRTNKWEFEYWDGRAMITFYNFADAETAAVTTNAFWPATIERAGRGLRLVYDRDLNQFFEKQNR